MGGRRLDLPQTILYPRLLVDMGQCNRRHPHNGIHRGTNVMGHVGQEAALGPVCFFRRMKSILKRRFLPFQFLDALLLLFYKTLPVFHTAILTPETLL